jgi:hypothetical protein
VSYPFSQTRASHVNTGTSIPKDELPWPEETDRPVAELPKLHVEVDNRSEVTPYGGLALAVQLVFLLKVPEIIDKHVHVLERHLPYHESDHVLAQALNLYSGGTCLEDMANLQQSEAVLRMLGACRLPDPTTGGDFLRRFDDEVNPGSLGDLRAAGDEIQNRAWKKIKKRRKRRKGLAAWTMVDVDGHWEETTGVQKEADFDRKGRWGYLPLAVTLGGTQEVLALRNRIGIQRSSTGAAEILRGALRRVKSHLGKKVLARADSDFDLAGMRRVCEEKGSHFAFVGREFSNRPGIAESIPERNWKPFRTRAARMEAERKKAPGYRPRQKKENRRKARAAERGWTELELAKQWVAEVPYTYGDSPKAYRLVIRRQLIEHKLGQLTLFTEYRYRYVITNLPKSWTAIDVIDATYQRCDQENLIEQLGSGIAAWRMPVAELAGNSAWLEIARLAWNLGKWVAQLALPTEVVRWEWKRFRHAFVVVPAQVLRRAKQIWIRISGSHRFVEEYLAAHTRLQR